LQGKASADHTTLLLNCYTKLKDVEKLDQFLRGSGAADTTPSLNFDVETAVKVLSHSCIHLSIHFRQTPSLKDWRFQLLFRIVVIISVHTYNSHVGDIHTYLG